MEPPGHSKPMEQRIRNAFSDGDAVVEFVNLGIPARLLSDGAFLTQLFKALLDVGTFRLCRSHVCRRSVGDDGLF
jgi:hypothetical protein